VLNPTRDACPFATKSFPIPRKLKTRVPTTHPRRGVRLAEERQAVMSAWVLWRDRLHEVTIICSLER